MRACNTHRQECESQSDHFQMLPTCNSQVDVVAGGGAKEVPAIHIRYL